MYQKKYPQRKCIGCQQMKLKNELVRVVRSKEGEISIDLTGKKAGRGAYICHSRECLESAKKARRLEKAFSCRIPDEIYDALLEELN